MKLKTLKKYTLFKDQELVELKLLETQGLCNINYKLKTSKQNYLIRVFKHTHNDKKRRKKEFKTQNKASKKNIASKAYLIDEKNSLMICGFIEGVHKSTLKTNDIKQLCKSLKKLHKIKTKQKTYDLEKDFLEYGKILKDKESKKLIKQSLKELKKIKRFKFEPALCHHDLNQQNILFCKNNEVKFIDWEFSCVNDICGCTSKEEKRNKEKIKKITPP